MRSVIGSCCYGRWMLALFLLAAASASWGWESLPTLKATSEPLRTLSLPAGQDPARWAQANGLTDWRRLPAANGRQFVSFRADDARWSALQAQCDNSNPAAPACLNASCQSVQSSHQGKPSNTWLLPRAPDLNAALAGRPDGCSAGLEGMPWRGVLPDDADPACWVVRQLNPCQSEQTPAEYLKPHARPDQLVVLIPEDGRDLLLWAQNLGLQVLEEVTLNSTGERLVRLLRPRGSASSLDGWVSLLGGMAGVSAVQKDVAYFTLVDDHAVASAASASLAVASIPDPLAAFNYAPALSRAEPLMARWDGSPIDVAVIDTGVDREHPELQGRVVSAVDFSGRGYSADPHGTGVAAIIAASRGNGIGAYGVAPGVRLHSYKACQPRDPGSLAARCWSSSLIKALDAAIMAETPLINMSLGGPPSPLLERLVREATRRGLMVIAAAGNGGPNAQPLFPAAWPEALAVTAVDAAGQLYPQANRGAYIELSAPGVDIITAGPSAGQPLLSGTSMATAHATGVAALLLQLAPQTRGEQLHSALVQFGRDLGGPGPDADYGAGLLDACATAAALSGQPQCGEQP
ncbi:S8 family peptidase [Motiliproteus sediminis]|uniref:S8 family peptidase n=1 Tax=Motiliproteus sediminis TaxID=1468178 RepID=UPI001AEF98DE|nr:S8 family serine peptidase [Motiliproteus sediminis]